MSASSIKRKGIMEEKAVRAQKNAFERLSQEHLIIFFSSICKYFQSRGHVAGTSIVFQSE